MRQIKQQKRQQLAKPITDYRVTVFRRKTSSYLVRLLLTNQHEHISPPLHGSEKGVIPSHNFLLSRKVECSIIPAFQTQHLTMSDIP